jgi:hypothetical protein
MASFFTSAEANEIRFAGKLDASSEGALEPLPTSLETIAGRCVEAAQTQLGSARVREAHRLIATADKLTALMRRSDLRQHLEKAQDRVKYRGVPKIPHDKAYLEMISSMRRADNALLDLKRHARLVLSTNDTDDPLAVTVRGCAEFWREHTGKLPGASVHPMTGEVRGPFVKFVTAFLKTLRRKASGIPSGRRATPAAIRSALRRYVNGQKEQGK